jgi:HEPN domain-containing protein
MAGGGPRHEARWGEAVWPHRHRKGPEGRQEMTDDKTTEFADNISRQVFDLWINPEIERRKKTGNLPQPICAAQVIFTIDGGPPTVRLNSEVRAAIKIKDDGKYPIGHKLVVTDTIVIDSIDLTDVDANAGHITVVFGSENIFVAWDARYNAGIATELVEKAGAFIETAKLALDGGHLDPAIDNLFSAAELVSKAELIAFNKRVLDTKQHDVIKSEINKWRKLGNVPDNFVDAYNHLDQARSSARYGKGTHSISNVECRQYLEAVTATANWLEDRLPKRPKVKL